MYPDTEDIPVEVDFDSTFAEGLNNNYGIQLRSLELKRGSFLLQEAVGRVTPYIDFDATVGKGVNADITTDGTQVLESNLVFPTRSGISVYIGARGENTDEVNLPDPNYNLEGMGAWVGINMPLLRGFGENSPANTAIRTATLNQAATNESLSNEVMTFVRDFLNAYLALKHETVQYALQQEALKESLKNQQSVAKLIENERLPRVESVRSDTEVLRQQLGLETVELGVFDAYYQLMMLVGVKQDSLLQAVPRLDARVPDPNVNAIENMLHRYALVDDRTLKQTPVYKYAKLLSDEEGVQLEFTRNQRYHQLDLDFRVSQFDYASISEQFGSTYPGTSGLLTLTYTLPLINDEKKGAYLAQLVEYEMSKAQLDELLFETRVQIQQAVVGLRQLLALYKTLTGLAVGAQDSFEFEKEKFKLGQASQIDVNLSLQEAIAANRNQVTVKFRIYTTIAQLQYLLGELPTSDVQLDDFTLQGYLNFY
ncbi:MAG: TolC family protein [Gammaproteobacteria bacterium]|nr:TolC family protein [Gammaproteobacteria bacterium]